MKPNAMKKVNLVPGVKYKGYAMLNDYGEIQFTPEQTGVNKGKYSIVKETDEYSIAVTKKYIILRERVDKQNGLPLIHDFMKTVNNIINDLRQYEF